MSEAANKKPAGIPQHPRHGTDRNYRLPLAGMVSILHRISGFAAVPVAAVPAVPARAEPDLRNLVRALLRGFLATPFVKLIILALSWAYLHHFTAGIRHLFMDTHMGLDKDGSRNRRQRAGASAWC